MGESILGDRVIEQLEKSISELHYSIENNLLTRSMIIDIVRLLEKVAVNYVGMYGQKSSFYHALASLRRAYKNSPHLFSQAFDIDRINEYKSIIEKFDARLEDKKQAISKNKLFEVVQDIGIGPKRKIKIYALSEQDAISKVKEQLSPFPGYQVSGNFTATEK